MRHSASPIAQYDLSSLRVIGTVGEPINPEAWKWYFNNVGRGKCTLVDTYWQTETGGHVCSNFHGVTPMKPGSCTVPYYGIQFAIVDPQVISCPSFLYANRVLISSDRLGRRCSVTVWRECCVLRNLGLLSRELFMVITIAI